MVLEIPTEDIIAFNLPNLQYTELQPSFALLWEVSPICCAICDRKFDNWYDLSKHIVQAGHGDLEDLKQFIPEEKLLDEEELQAIRWRQGL